MKIRDYPGTLEQFVNYHIGEFLDHASKSRLINRAQALKTTIQRRGGTWRFSIPRDEPLTFKQNDRNLQIDISCEIEGEDDKVKKQNILLRVWCYDKSICYRDGIDHPDIREKLENSGWKRVILRFHFDLRAPNVRQPEPLYHLQVGGRKPKENENCWLPEQIEIPRFPYPPMDVILLCEFILMNFFHKEYEEIRKKPEWISFVRKSQDFFQKPYFEMCYKCFNESNDDTLMGNLVTHEGGL